MRSIGLSLLVALALLLSSCSLWARDVLLTNRRRREIPAVFYEAFAGAGAVKPTRWSMSPSWHVSIGWSVGGSSRRLCSTECVIRDRLGDEH